VIRHLRWSSDFLDSVDFGGIGVASHPGFQVRQGKATKSLVAHCTPSHVIFSSLRGFNSLLVTMSMDDIPLNFSISLGSHSANYVAICLLLATVCVVTRIVTGQRSNLSSEDVSKPKYVPIVPYFVPWLGSAISFGLRFQDFLAEAQSV
jgi:hypothetical protein